VKPQTVVPILFSPKVVVHPKPRLAAYFVFSIFADVQRWYRDRCDGKTFKLAYPMSVTSLYTLDEMLVPARGDNPPGTPCGKNLWMQAMVEMNARGIINLCNEHQTFYVKWFRDPTAPEDRTWSGSGGMIGKDQVRFGCGYARPGISSTPDHKPWLACGVPVETLAARGWGVINNGVWYPLGDRSNLWACTWGAIAGGTAHELLHCWAALGHSDEPSISRSYWNYPNTPLLDEQKAALLESGVLS